MSVSHLSVAASVHNVYQLALSRTCDPAAAESETVAHFEARMPSLSHAAVAEMVHTLLAVDLPWRFAA